MFYLHPELHANVTAPKQTTWDVESLRAEGEEIFASAADDSDNSLLSVAEARGITLRIFTPPSATPTTPVMIAPHGGGYVAGKAIYDDARNTELAQRHEVIVVSPDYRLAPEHPFPAGKEDVAAAFEWAAKHYPDAPLLGYGDSAGSGLLYTALVDFLSVPGRSIAGAVFLEPCLDPTLDTSSMYSFAEGPIWTRRAAEHAWRAYCGSTSPEEVYPPVSEAVARIHAAANSLPAWYVVVNPVDPLRDEGIDFALNAVDAGVNCQLHMWEGTFHGSLDYPIDSQQERQASIGRFLRNAVADHSAK
ncbi:alpha/beta hydrolase fold domain-containing protein [Corynebacterium camporealensis]